MARARILCVETKRPGQSLTPYQHAFLDVVRSHGGIALVVHSVAELEQALAGVPGGHACCSGARRAARHRR